MYFPGDISVNIRNRRSRAMNILMIYEDGKGEGGGVQTHVSILQESLSVSGHQVLTLPVPPLYSEKEAGPRRAISILTHSLVMFTYVIRLLLLSGRDDFNFNIIHAHEPRLPLILGLFVKQISRRPLIVTIHGAKTQALRLNKEWKRADKIIAVSKEILSNLIYYGLDRTKIVYIPNMVKLNRLGPNTGSEEKNILFMGRLHAGKIGILKILLAATPSIVHRLPETRVYIAGSHGSKYNEIEHIANEINKKFGKRIVTILGYVSNPDKIIAEATVVIGVGRVALEAMIQGKPAIVGTSIDDTYFTGDLVNKENIEKLETYNFTGRNYDKRIYPNEMADMIVNLLKDDSHRKMVAEHCRSYVKENFENMVIMKKIVSQYFDCIKKSFSP